MSLIDTLTALTAAGFRAEFFHEPGPDSPAPPHSPPALMVRLNFRRRLDGQPWADQHQTEALAHEELAAARFPDQNVAQTLWRLAWSLDRPAAGQAAQQLNEPTTTTDRSPTP